MTDPRPRSSSDPPSAAAKDTDVSRRPALVEHHLTVSRSARYYSFGDEGSSDVWIAAHGYGQLARAFARGLAHLASAGARIVVPEALNRFYLAPGPSGSHADARAGATWMTREDREREIADYVAYFDAVRAAVATDTTRLHVLGFSQGVATVTRWVRSGSRQVQRLVLWAGSLPPEVDLREVAAQVVEPVIYVYGLRDVLAPSIKFEEQLRRLEESGIAYEVRTFNGGHRLDDGVLEILGSGE